MGTSELVYGQGAEGLLTRLHGHQARVFAAFGALFDL